MTGADWGRLVIALVLVMLAGLLAAGEAALSSISKARADRLVEEGRSGATRLRKLADDPPAYLNTALFVRTVLEISAIVLVAKVVFTNVDVTWEAGAIAAGVMIVISFVFWGVAPRTLGRQNADTVSL